MASVAQFRPCSYVPTMDLPFHVYTCERDAPAPGSFLLQAAPLVQAFVGGTEARREEPTGRVVGLFTGAAD